MIIIYLLHLYYLKNPVFSLQKVRAIAEVGLNNRGNLGNLEPKTEKQGGLGLYI